MPTKLISESNNPKAYSYANNTGALLKIESTITGYQEVFPAFLTDFSQTFQSNWQTEDVYGRNDPIATFQGTRRTLSLSFDLPAATAEDAKENLVRYSNLIQMMYPGYYTATAKKIQKTAHSGVKVVDSAEPDSGPGISSGNTVHTEYIPTGTILSKSPLVKITFGNLIQANSTSEDTEGLLGWIGSLSWTPNLEMGMFVVGEGVFYPKVVSLSFDFNVLHQSQLGQTDNGNNVTTGWLGKNPNFPFKK